MSRFPLWFSLFLVVGFVHYAGTPTATADENKPLTEEAIEQLPDKELVPTRKRSLQLWFKTRDAEPTDAQLLMERTLEMANLELEILKRAEQLKLSDEQIRTYRNNLATIWLRALLMAVEGAENWQDEITLKTEILKQLTHLHGAEHSKVIDARLSLEDTQTLKSLTKQQREELAKAEELNKKAYELKQVKKFQQSQAEFAKVAGMKKRILGEKHHAYGAVLFSLGLGHAEAGEAGEAVPYFQAVRPIYKDAFGETHPRYQMNIELLGLMYRELSQPRKAIPVLEHLCDLKKKTLKNTDPQLATYLNVLGRTYTDAGEYEKALPLLQQVVVIRKLHQKEDPVKYASSLNNLALAWSDLGESTKCQQLLKQAMEIESKSLPLNDPARATTLSNLGEHYRKLGEYTKALPLAAEAVKLSKRSKVPDEYSTCLNNLVLLLSDMGAYEEVLPLAKGVVRLNVTAPNVSPVNLAASLSQLADVHAHLKQFDKAAPLYQQALRLYEKSVGKEDAKYVYTLNSLGSLQTDLGNYDEANKTYLEASSLITTTLGENHISHSTCLENLAFLHISKKEHDQALKLYQQSMKIRHQHLEYCLTLSSEAQSLNLLQQHSISGKGMLSFVPVNPTTTQEIYSSLWASKGLLLKRLVQRQEQFQSVESNEHRQLYQKYLQTRQRLAEVALSPISDDEGATHQTEIKRLTEEKERLEQQLASSLPRFRQERTVADSSPSLLEQHLPANTVFLDIRRYTHFTPLSRDAKERWKTDVRYVIFLVSKSAPVRRIDLGSEAVIKTHLRQWRKAIQAGQDSVSRAKLGLLFQPVWKGLPAETHTLLISSDGVLSGLPWAALPTGKPGKILLEDYAIATVPSGPFLLGQLLNQTSPLETNSKTLLVGNVKYDDSPETRDKQPVLAQRGQPSPVYSDIPLTWEPLPATRGEIESIRKLFGQHQTQVLQGEQAGTGRVLQNLSQVQIAHLATHGFFADAKFRSRFHLQESNLEQAIFRSGLGRGSAVSRNPLLMSGVVLAGVNLPQKNDEQGLPKGDGGILSAETIAGQNLRNLRLVVLSACETGLGDVADGEGVYGLQRAFHSAGVPDVIGSLWKVDDNATSALMQLFYFNLKKGHAPIHALRIAQLELYYHPDLISGWSKGSGLRAPKVKQISEKPAVPFSPTTSEKKTGSVHLWAAFTLSGSGQTPILNPKDHSTNE